MPAPLISVIVVCRNPGSHLPVALASAWDQEGSHHEIVVIDGASTDGTREWLETRRSQLGSLLSEPDRGIYDAMNKGVAAARGDWLLFLGADDRLLDQVFARIAPLLQRAAAEVVGGEAIYDDGRVYRLGDKKKAVRRNFAHHQATFYHRSLFAAHGVFDPSFQVMADYEFNLRLVKAKVDFEPLPIRIARCGSGGMSDSGKWTGYREEIQIRHLYFPGWRCLGWDLVSTLRFLRKKIYRSQTTL